MAAEETNDELLLANDENRQEQEQGNFKGTNGHGSKFIILKRSRSLGIYFYQIPFHRQQKTMSQRMKV